MVTNLFRNLIQEEISELTFLFAFPGKTVKATTVLCEVPNSYENLTQRKKKHLK